MIDTTSISIVSEYSLIRNNHRTDSGEGDHTFTLSCQSGRNICIFLDYNSGNIVSTTNNVCFDAETIQQLVSYSIDNSFPISEITKTFIGDIINENTIATRKLIALIKYHLRHFDIKEHLFSVKTRKWRDSEGVFRLLPAEYHCSIDARSSFPLNTKTALAIQQSLDHGVIPLQAMRHLHRARNESIPHYKWIDATIAAELAVKEILCRVKPELEKILLELPSPPIEKLYGSILHAYIGIESPYKKKLKDGQALRNKLVHRHNEKLILSEQAIDYVNIVEKAIFHLLCYIYPENQLLKHTTL